MTKSTELIKVLDGAGQATREAIADQLLTPGECAERLGVSSSTFLWWTTKGKDFPDPFKSYGGRRGYRPLYWWNDIEPWYTGHKSKGSNATH